MHSRQKESRGGNLRGFASLFDHFCFSGTCRDLKEAAELDLSARENAVAAKEESAADKEKAVQASLTDLEEKEGALTARQQKMEIEEKTLGEEKREMLRREAELSEHEKVSLNALDPLICTCTIF